MRDEECVRFLQWALPRLGMRWRGFRKVRSQVCKRIGRRLAELGLDGLAAYRDRLGVDPEEWRRLDRLCRVTISRFWRDRATFEALGATVLPEIAAAAGHDRRRTLDVWSCGCASGEEPHSLAILWLERLTPRFPRLTLRVLATDLDLHMLERAGRASYPAGALRELPRPLADRALEEHDGELRLRCRYRRIPHRVLHDVRDGAPGRRFDLILCRNLVFTYFDEKQQHSVGGSLVDALRPGGALVVGAHERPPDAVSGLAPWIPGASIYRRVASPSLE